MWGIVRIHGLLHSSSLSFEKNKCLSCNSYKPPVQGHVEDVRRQVDEAVQNRHVSVFLNDFFV